MPLFYIAHYFKPWNVEINFFTSIHPCFFFLVSWTCCMYYMIFNTTCYVDRLVFMLPFVQVILASTTKLDTLYTSKRVVTQSLKSYMALAMYHSLHILYINVSLACNLSYCGYMCEIVISNLVLCARPNPTSSSKTKTNHIHTRWGPRQEPSFSR
jgi:hypothetical protein